VVRRAADPRVVVLDTRGDRTAWLASHLRGSLHTPPSKFSEFAGSWVKPDDGVILLVDDLGETDGFVRQLLRIGFDLIQGVASADALAQAGAALVSTPTARFADLPALLADAPPTPVLDVRRAAEFKSGHVRGAQNIAHTRLRSRLAEVPDHGPLIVHCQSGVRAVGACSLLERTGRDVLCINDAFPNCPASVREA
jgi:hydroxyacylglutathione hydrolase